MRNSPKSTALAVLVMAFPLSALADLFGTQSLTANTSLNLDTGVVSSSGGDILWNTTSLTPQANATAYNIIQVNGAAYFPTYNQASLAAIAANYSKLPISAATLTLGDLFAVHTNGGNYAAVLVTAVNGGSITLQFNTFGSTGTPVVTNVENNYGEIPAGFPNSGIAQGALFFIVGTGLADPSAQAVLQSSTATNGLPTTLNGASVKVTVNGITTVPVFYYAIAGALGLVLPSNTPVGNGQIAVTYNGKTSATFPIQVVQSAMGFDAYYGTGSGLGVATNSTTGLLYNYTNSIPPSTNVTLWGSGLGADPARDTKYSVANIANINGLAHIYVGGVDATILYQGPSGFPGLNQVNITIPSNAPTGCNVELVGVGAAGIPTNFTTLPIGVGACSDPQFGTTGAQFQALSAQPAVNIGVLRIFQSTSQSGANTVTNNTAIANFQKYTGLSYGSASGSVSLGGCTVSQAIVGSPSPFVTTALDAGGITLTGPFGTSATLNPLSQVPGESFAQLSAAFIPATGGTFVFQGAGGSGVGAFNASVVFPNPLMTWTNQAAASTVNRAAGLTVTWVGGGSGGFVNITGSSASAVASGTFICVAPVSAAQFTVPSYVLEALPAGTGSVSVQNQSNYQNFTASGLDYGVASGIVGYYLNSTFN